MENQTNVCDQNTQQIEKNPVGPPVQFSEKPKINYWMILTIVLLILIISGGIYYLLESRKTTNQFFTPTGSSTNSQSIPPKNSTTKILCLTVDGQANIIDANKSYYQEDLIPLESRITAAFRFSGDSILFYKYYPGSSNFVSNKGYDSITGVQIPHIILPDKNNGNFFIDTLSLPHIFSPYPANSFGEEKIPPPLYSDFFGTLMVVGTNNKFYFLAGGSCSYGSGICSQKLISIDSTGYKVKEIKIPSEYSPEIKSWTGGQEGGISNVNTFLEEIVESNNNKIIFKTSDMNKTKTVKYAVLDTSNNSWSESEIFKGSSLKYPYDVLKTNKCISYVTNLGNYIVKLDKGIANSFLQVGKDLKDIHVIDKETIGLYFVKN